MKYSVIAGLLFLFIFNAPAFSQKKSKTKDKEERSEDCPETTNRKAKKLYIEGITNFDKREYGPANKCFKDAIELEPDYVDAFFMLAKMQYHQYYHSTKDMGNTSKLISNCEKNSLKVIELCPNYSVYVNYFLGDIAFGKEKWNDAVKYYTAFMKDPDKVKTDKDYNFAEKRLKDAKFYQQILGNPVPFNPRCVTDISTELDEYLVTITADNEYAYYTRRYPKSGTSAATSGIAYIEKFSVSQFNNGKFDRGEPMQTPFNLNQNEGGATLTVDNLHLYYTVCQTNANKYFNCDICYSDFANGEWSPIKNIGSRINKADCWDSQPTISADGRTLYFVSDRPGGYGGYDIYVITKDGSGNWSEPHNLGPTINTKGNEKTPFIHTDSQTLYFSSGPRDTGDSLIRGLSGVGGYDIFFSKMDDKNMWQKPKNLGYPINSADDDLGFFVSTDGKTGYFSSNKKNLGGKGGWDLYAFELYKEARPEKVLLIKGDVTDQQTQFNTSAKLELTNVSTKKITQIPVDSVSGKYAIAVLFNDDYVLTVKKDGYAYDARYISEKDSTFSEPKKLNLELKTMEVGDAYTLNDLYYATNSAEIMDVSKIIIDGFIEFLFKNPKVSVSIQGHTDNIGNDEDNMVLSEARAKSVFDYLVLHNVEEKRISYKGFGESKPVVSNDSEEGRSKNRRTEFVITKIDE